MVPYPTWASKRASSASCSVKWTVLDGSWPLLSSMAICCSSLRLSLQQWLHCNVGASKRGRACAALASAAWSVRVAASLAYFRCLVCAGCC
jgi:hypothetical protein